MQLGRIDMDDLLRLDRDVSLLWGGVVFVPTGANAINVICWSHFFCSPFSTAAALRTSCFGVHTLD